MKYLYHATPFANLGSISCEGLKPQADGLVYLGETENDAAKFIAIRGCKDILIVKVKVPKRLENTIIETFDHSYSFFQCRSFASSIPIEPDRIV